MRDRKMKNGENIEGIFIFKDSFIRFILLFTGLIGGIGSAITWVSHGAYISNCASNKNKGIFNGYAWILFNFCNIIGNILGGYLIEVVDYATFFFILTFISVLAALWFLGIKDPEPVKD
jgi:MFS family permease